MSKKRVAAVEFLNAINDNYEHAKLTGLITMRKDGLGEELNLPNCGLRFSQIASVTHESAMRILREARAILRQTDGGNFLWLTQEHNRQHAA